KTFVTRKITTILSEISVGLSDVLKLGNLDAKRDWGYAKDYVEMMWLMLQQDKPEDFVIATGKMYTVREFVEKAAKHIDMELVWKGEGVEEKGYDAKTGKLVVEVDPRYFRPAEVDLLIGDATRARTELGWTPRVGFAELVTSMVDADLADLQG
ncbi:MAG: GDP-mannose 4,6-dehydratase, partial [Actinomycetota bacterium]